MLDLTPIVPAGLLEARDEALLEPIAAAFVRVRATMPGALPCGRGCSQCCVAFFDVTSLDVWRLREGLRRMPLELRLEVVARAREVVALAQTAVPEWGPPYDVRDIGAMAFASIGQRVSARCPALGPDGACQVYDHRPRICRLQGLSYVDPSGGAALPDFCAEVFGDEEYLAIPPQPLALFDQWEAEAGLRRDVSNHLPPALAGNYRTFVAGAICALADTLEPLPASGAPPLHPTLAPR